MSGNAIAAADQSQLLAHHAVGDICHRFYDADGRLVASDIDARVVGIAPEVFRRIPRRIGIAGGTRKHASIRAALRGRWINVLLTDVDTARALIAEDCGRSWDR